MIENDIGKIKMWMEDNQLKMNDAKTEFIVIGDSKWPPEEYIGPCQNWKY